MIRLKGSILGMSRARYRLHVDHPADDLLRGLVKPPDRRPLKNRPEHLFGRDQDFAVPGLFSELFNVAASRPAQMTTE
jgi:hypothetical protein